MSAPHSDSLTNTARLQDLLGPPGGWSILPTVTWLLGPARDLTDPKDVLSGVIDRLVEAGAPVARMRVGVGTLNPQVVAWAVIWADDGDGVRYWEGPHEILWTDQYQGSPAQRIRDTGQEVHANLIDEPPAGEHSFFAEIRAAGMTGYFGMPLKFRDGLTNIFSISTRDPKGFTEEDLAKFRALSRVIGPVVEVLELNRMAHRLLDTYIGRRSGANVFRGKVRRGDGETIQAAIWYSDLRDFTRHSETLAPPEMLEMLNGYFEYVMAAAQPRGGEALQFIGDAILMVFPVGNGVTLPTACQAALDTAVDAFTNLAVLNHRRMRHQQPPIRFGVGLHHGTVIHGNVGARDRLAFNVIGPAVNRTARIESKTKDLATPLLFSAEFATEIASPYRPAGEVQMKGVAGNQTLYTLDPPIEAI